MPRDGSKKIFMSNPGMQSRIAHHVDFPDYSPEELLQISKLMLAQSNYRLSADAEKALIEYIVNRMKIPNFANARSIRNALDRSRLRQANRLFSMRSGKLSKIDLMTIEAEAILASRVFAEGMPDDEAKG